MTLRTLLLLPVLLLLGADGEGCRYEPKDSGSPDADGDGYTVAEGDCDDEAAKVNPGADEYCDEIDNDCDGWIDESDALDAPAWYRDADEDGFGATGSEPVYACGQHVEHVSDDSDCDDEDGTVNPEASEICDEIDNDCDGLLDVEDPDVTDADTWYIDHDGDGYGDPATEEQRCFPDENQVRNGQDCNDLREQISPEASEICDGIDNNCDELLDDDDPAVTGQPTWYADSDGDGFGDPDSSSQACSQPSGSTSDTRDCDDSDEAINPDATEVCDEIDNDCDEQVDEDDASDASTWYADSDSDGYGDAGSTSAACSQPSGYTSDDQDCDDGDADVNPGALESCDEVDNDCDGDTDEDDAEDAGTWYSDSDGDGYGATGTGVTACEGPSGTVADDGDCHDRNAGIHPGADEYCDGVDSDCDGDADEDDSLDAPSWYSDADGDGWADPASGATACAAPSDALSATWASDCDDTDSDVHPEASEICDGIDNDCDALVDSADDEVCDDGVDNDCDALVDCEDGGCALDSSCDEAMSCDDGSDNDGDGLTDCDDEDCWTSTCHPEGVRSRVHGGTMLQATRHAWNDGGVEYSYGGPRIDIFNWDSHQRSGVALLSDVWGTLQVLPSGASWATTSARSTCSWSLSQATASFHFTTSEGWLTRSMEVYDVARAGVTVEPGCRVAGSWFLPDQVRPWNEKGYAYIDFRSSMLSWIDKDWYQGSLRASSAWATSTVGSTILGTTSSRVRWSTFDQGSSWRSLDIELGSSGQTWWQGDNCRSSTYCAWRYE